MIKIIDIPKENDVVDIDENRSSLVVVGHARIEKSFSKLISIKKEGSKLILQVPSNEKKYRELLDSAADDIKKLFNMSLYPHFNPYGTPSFPSLCNKRGLVSVTQDFPTTLRVICDEESLEKCYRTILKKMKNDGFITDKGKKSTITEDMLISDLLDPEKNFGVVSQAQR